MAESSCFICRKHRGEVTLPGGAIHEDDRLYAGHARLRSGEATAYPGYFLIQTKRRVPGLSDLTAGEAAAVDVLAAWLATGRRRS